MKRDFVPRLAPKVRLKHDRHANQWMLLYPERGQVLDARAAEIAERCDGKHSIAEIADELARAHGAPRDEIESDVAEFVDELAAKGLLA